MEKVLNLIRITDKENNIVEKDKNGFEFHRVMGGRACELKTIPNTNNIILILKNSNKNERGILIEKVIDSKGMDSTAFKLENDDYIYYFQEG